jgi:hypothetical protein
LIYGYLLKFDIMDLIKIWYNGHLPNLILWTWLKVDTMDVCQNLILWTWFKCDIMDVCQNLILCIFAKIWYYGLD